MSTVTDVTNERLAELERLANAATPGPWFPRWGGEPGYVYSQSAERVIAMLADEQNDGLPRPNSQLIAAARTAVPELIAEVRRLQALTAKAVAIANAACDSDWCEGKGIMNPNAPCPYCPNADTLLVETTLEAVCAFYVACPRCQANGPRLPTAEAARTAWNDVAALWRAVVRIDTDCGCFTAFHYNTYWAITDYDVSATTLSTALVTLAGEVHA